MSTYNKFINLRANPEKMKQHQLDFPKKRIRVLQIIPTLGIGGAERLVVDLAKHLDKERFLVGISALRKTKGTSFEREVKENHIPYFLLNVKGVSHPVTFYKLVNLFYQFKPDIIHTHLTTIRYLLFPATICFIPAHIHTIHSLADKDAPLHSETFPSVRVVKLIAFRIFKVKPVSVSRNVAESVKRVYGVDSIVIYNGIKTAEYLKSSTKHNDKRTVYLLNIARFSNQKNHSLLLEAFHKAISKEPRLRLGLVGDGELRQKVEEKARGLGLSDKVDFLGWREDIPELLSNCDIFVLSSDWEGFGIVLVEAMAAGKPVVATRVGGIPEVVGDGLTGLLVPPRDPDALADAILKLARYEDLRKRMGEKGREKAIKEFDISITARKYEKLYKEALGQIGVFGRK